MNVSISGSNSKFMSSTAHQIPFKQSLRDETPQMHGNWQLREAQDYGAGKRGRAEGSPTCRKLKRRVSPIETTMESRAHRRPMSGSACHCRATTFPQDSSAQLIKASVIDGGFTQTHSSRGRKERPCKDTSVAAVTLQAVSSSG